MARYTGPKHRLARREGKNVLDKQSPSLARRLNVPPGVHGPKGKIRFSEYSIQLREKQAAKRSYALLEKQFRNYYAKAKVVKGRTGEVMLQMLETRLDSIVYRLGFVPSRNMARQLVTHGHILVNGTIVQAPSFVVKVGDVVSLGEKAMKIPAVEKSMQKEEIKVLSWLERQVNSGKLLVIPTREQIPTDTNEQLIVEYYSK